MHRLFVALRLPADVCEALLATQEGVNALRWQDEEQLHLTLRFIGAVERPVAEDIAAVLGTVTGQPLTLRLAGVGRFDRRDGDAIFARIAPDRALSVLHKKVDQAIARVGLPHEGRAYLPHVTIARIPRAAAGDPAIDAWIARHAGLSSEPFAINHMTLFESDLGRDGARYETIARWPLG